MLADHLKILMAILAADATLAGLVSSRIYGGELPRVETGAMPEKALVVKYSGSPGGIGSADNVPVIELRIDFLSYGETFWEADRVRRAAYMVMKQLQPQTQNGLLVYRALHSGGPAGARDPDTDWPFILDSWDVLAAAE